MIRKILIAVSIVLNGHSFYAMNDTILPVTQQNELFDIYDSGEMPATEASQSADLADFFLNNSEVGAERLTAIPDCFDDSAPIFGTQTVAVTSMVPKVTVPQHSDEASLSLMQAEDEIKTDNEPFIIEVSTIHQKQSVKEKLEIIRKELSYLSNVEAREKKATEWLFKCVRASKSAQLVEVLVSEFKAHVNDVNDSGETPLDIASSLKKDTQQLKRLGAKTARELQGRLSEKKMDHLRIVKKRRADVLEYDAEKLSKKKVSDDGTEHNSAASSIQSFDVKESKESKDGCERQHKRQKEIPASCSSMTSSAAAEIVSPHLVEHSDSAVVCQDQSDAIQSIIQGQEDMLHLQLRDPYNCSAVFLLIYDAIALAHNGQTALLEQLLRVYFFDIYDHIATLVRVHDITSVSAFIKCGMDVNIYPQNNHSLLFIASVNRDLDLAYLLVSNRATLSDAELQQFVMYETMDDTQGFGARETVSRLMLHIYITTCLLRILKAEKPFLLPPVNTVSKPLSMTLSLGNDVLQEQKFSTMPLRPIAANSATTVTQSTDVQ